MKNLFLALVATISLLSCSDKIEADGPMITAEIGVPISVTAISIKSTMKLTLSDEIAEGEIKITTNENILNYIDVVTSDEQIDIQLESNRYDGLDIQIVASAKQFSSIIASGASLVTVNGEAISFDSYSISLSGASEVNIEATLDTKSCSISTSGVSNVEGDNFSADALAVDLSGSSAVTMGINNSITGTLRGASTLNYWGEAASSAELNGASNINKIK